MEQMTISLLSGRRREFLSSKQNVLDAWNRIWIFKSYVLGPDSYEIFDTSNTWIDLHFPKIQKIIISKYYVDIN